MPGAIVLLSDGSSNVGPGPLAAAQQAKADHIPIYTISLGHRPTGPSPSRSMARRSTRSVPVSSQELAQIAQASGGKAYTAADSAKASAVYAHLAVQLGHKKVKRELTADVAGGGLVLLLAGGALTLLWFRPPHLWPSHTSKPFPSRRTDMTDIEQTTQQRHDARDALQQVLYEIKRVIVGQDAMLERLLVSLLAGGHVLLEGVPGPGQDAHGQDARGVAGRHLRPHPVHPGPRARRPRRHAGVAPGHGLVRHRARPGVPQLPARRRDQPRPGQGPVRAARGHAGAAGDDRRAPATACRCRSS